MSENKRMELLFWTFFLISENFKKILEIFEKRIRKFSKKTSDNLENYFGKF